MWLSLVIPLTLAWPILALAAEGTSLTRYRGTPMTELLALFFAVVAYGALFLGLSGLIGGLVGLVVGALISSLLLPLLLFLGFKIFGVKPAATASAH